MYYTYIIRCRDNSLYTGITNNLERRMNEHFNKTSKCAKYTLTHIALRLEAVWISDNRVMASKLEYHLKRKTKLEKENLILNNKLFDNIFKDRLCSNDYKRMEIKKYI